MPPDVVLLIFNSIENISWHLFLMCQSVCLDPSSFKTDLCLFLEGKCRHKINYFLWIQGWINTSLQNAQKSFFLFVCFLLTCLALSVSSLRTQTIYYSFLSPTSKYRTWIHSVNKWLELLLPKRPKKHMESSNRVLEANFKALFKTWVKS